MQKEGERKDWSKLLLQPPSDECVWWCNTSESDGASKCPRTLQSAPLWPCCQKPNSLLIPLRSRYVSAWPESEHHLPDWGSTSCLNDGFLILTPSFQCRWTVLAPSPAAARSFHKVSQLSKNTLTLRGLNRSVPEDVCAEMSSQRKSVSFRRSGKAASRVAGQQRSHRKSDKRGSNSNVLVGRCCHESAYPTENWDGVFFSCKCSKTFMWASRNKAQKTKCGVKDRNLTGRKIIWSTARCQRSGGSSVLSWTERHKTFPH